MKRRQFMQRMATSALLTGSGPVPRNLIAAMAGDGSGGPAKPQRDFFYRPENAWAGDFIPFYKNNRFHLFYLLSWRDIPGHGEGTPWYQVGTNDFIHFTEHGLMLARGTVEEQDLYVFTGSVVEGQGQYHIFYTGHNPHLAQRGLPMEAIMHAVSDDLLTWRKVPEDRLFAPRAMFEPDDWRDPFVFWDEEAREYRMLVAARLKTGPSHRRGCTALCTSKDLKHWEVREPLWAPGLYTVHECPDLFRMGDWWYLVFSEGSEQTATHYRMSRSLSGPWLAPVHDTFDCRSFYAAKTSSDGNRRYLFGWDATREGQKDDQRWRWGGNLVVHELVQETDGTLWVKVPESVDRAFSNTTSMQFRSGVGPAEMFPGGVGINTPGSFGCSPAGPLPSRCKIEATVEFAKGTRACGLMLRVSRDLDSAYYLRFEPERSRLVIDSWPRAGDIPYWIDSERPIELKAGVPVKVKVFLDGSVCVVYVDERIALSTRMYDLTSSDWGVFVMEGSAKFTKVAIFV